MSGDVSDDSGAGRMDALREAESLIAMVRERLPRRVDGRSISAITKTPYHAVLFNAGLSYRAAELAEASLELIHSHRRVAAAVTARALLETSALHYYGVKKIAAAVDGPSFVEADAILYRALVASKAYGDGSVQPIQVMTAIDHATKQFTGYRDFYDQLSELAHPNFFGTIAPYAGENETEDQVEFHPDFAPGVPAQEPARAVCTGLLVLGYSRQRLEASLPDFVALAESELRKGTPMLGGGWTGTSRGL